jgi:hypothetical protein
MKRLPILALLFAAPALAAHTSEVLVTTAGVSLPALNGRLGLEVYNYGPNALHCSFGTAISSNAFWVINSVDTTDSSHPKPGYWSAAAKSYQPIFCAAVSGNQVTGAATIVNEID